MFNTCIPIIIPSYEPDDRLTRLCLELKQADMDVIIVDDGSGEQYSQIFQKLHEDYEFLILRNAVNLGKGRALKHAFNFCLNHYDNLLGVVTADSDGQHKIGDIKRCIEELKHHPDSLILGCRDFKGLGIPWKSSFGNKLTKISFQYLCGLKVTDTQTGLRGIPSEFMKDLLSTSGERFEYETNMLLDSKGKVEIVEFPIETVYESKENHQTHFDPWRDSLMIYKIILSYSLTSVFSTIIDFIVFAIANGLGGSIALSTALARCCSSLFNFTLNRNMVFKVGGNAGIQLVKYLGLVIFSGTISATLIGWMSEWLPIEVIGIKAIVETVLFFFNYWVQRAFIFVGEREKVDVECRS